MAADESAQQPRRRGRPPGSKSTTRTRRRLDGHELIQQLNGMVAELIKENRKLKRQVEKLTARGTKAAVERSLRTIQRRVQKALATPKRRKRRTTAAATKATTRKRATTTRKRRK